MNKEKLDLLMQIKKKSDASKTQKNEYVSLMMELIKENGYSNQTEEYLFLGYSFAGVKPLVNLMNKMSFEERTAFVEQILSGKLYALNEKGISFKLLVDLLTAFIISFPQDKSIISKLIKLIPGKSKIKTGQLLGDAPKIIDKYFMSVISDNLKLPDFEALELTNEEVKKFADIYAFVISSIKPSKKISEKKIKHVLTWLTTDDIKQSVPENAQEMVQLKTTQSVIDKVPGLKPLTSDELKSLCERLLITVDHYKGLEKGAATLNAKISALEKELETKKAQLEGLENKIKEKEKALAELVDQNSSLKKELDEVKVEKIKLQGVVDVYSEDKESSQTEQLNAIASKLKAEYRDFKDALEMEMTVELGENIKEQVIQIFKILAKAGIDVESR